ncbi:bifunctional ADP-dependent (S)-NAD(P)H-hydrate dehydratase/NAD(P)H-hydrate epimerase [Vibrio sp. UCD-FRSSP16_10]|uniref:bifunctional ADP-dependent NAD(P)H-hydrate dehydratase/NAD(P)H-hydrate epimerase n=1 Tax=unclassified Vibrio TaxID=2614977 RepID=UPI0007FD23D6|nr:MULTISPECIES: bifunctional ADP-dependent NAD(P)H-hydrate dehydratase/NAD(P)H-hydrate epimerase [unclassified Vibrio]OBT13274.1 bifunctional ADP-dependent (S)-NAD(P)H-hydrate dehydratase/NAD(P)H-hydrate epimerase [Vibrio sp. UCD-FRSSP16_30]OBT19624.1 bifunctional ADP-dependent (S)-NAD(P)H-hydrate dehydratase/NAD(P)H-hydrate epimerase [Vibrio sp. UCD-FRSSP16_10]
MKPLYSATQVLRSEGLAAKSAGLSLYQLMERAGHDAFLRLKHYLSNGGKILVCCGSGNNGGDGFVVARLALESGFEVDVFQPLGCRSNTADAQQAQQAWQQHNKPILNHIDSQQKYDFIIDGLLGTGLQGKVRSNLILVIDAINALATPILSLDIPSGLDADTGVILGACIQAQETVTFVGTKKGLMTGKARNVVGHLYVANLGIASEFSLLEQAEAYCYETSDALSARPQRDNTSHKGSCGRALLIGGNQGTSGAIILATQACARVGAGLISALTHPDSIPPMLSRQPEVMPIALDKDLTTAVLPNLDPFKSAIGLGPGLGTDSWANHLFDHAINEQCSKVIDADALNILAKRIERYDLSRCVLTPHPGEAARLLGISIAKIEQDRYSAVAKLQEKYQCVVLLKGAGTLMCNGEQTWVISAGNSGMASGGMGDVLTGVITGLLCQGLTPTQAACLGAWLHSTAADNNAQQFGKIGMLASDLLVELRLLMNVDVSETQIVT